VIKIDYHVCYVSIISIYRKEKENVDL